MRFLTIITILLISFVTLNGQSERKVIRQGVKSYEKGNYSESEVQFRKASDINQKSLEAEFNTGAALYGQEKYEETVEQYKPLVDKSEDPETRAGIWHNIGNSLLESQQYAQSIEAYKNSLRLNPSDQDTKYNLAYARQKLEEQQQDQNQDQQDQQNQDQQGQQNQDQQDQQNQDQQDQQNQDQQDQQNQDQQDQQDQDQQDQDQQDQDQQDQQEQQEQQPRPQEISKEDAERMLQAIQQQEKDVKEKVDKHKAAVAKVKTDKDW